MNKNLLNKEVQDFIDINLRSDIHTILLGKKLFSAVENREVVEQLESKKKAQKKLPTWFETKNIYYANKLNLSQTSSEICAQYKANLVSGDSLADLTGGFGVDSYYFSKKIDKVFHIEKNREVSEIAKHNFAQMGVSNIVVLYGDGITFIEKNKQILDWIYLDPSRRDQSNKKVFFLEDCEPNVTKHLELLRSKSQNILIKTGPMLDLSMGLEQLDQVFEIHIVSLENEVKEVLWHLKPDFGKAPLVRTINFNKGNTETFQYGLYEKENAQAEFSKPLKYLYEPNAAIMKSGAFNLVSERYGLKKLQEHTHLYTSEALLPFPGRVFEIVKTIPYNNKRFKQLGIKKANITTRNFPETVVQIRKKFNLKDGGQNYLFFTKDTKNSLIVISAIAAARIKS